MNKQYIIEKSKLTCPKKRCSTFESECDIETFNSCKLWLYQLRELNKINTEGRLFNIIIGTPCKKWFKSPYVIKEWLEEKESPDKSSRISINILYENFKKR